MYRREVRSATESVEGKGVPHLWNLDLNVLALRGDMFDVKVVVGRVVLLLVPQRILPREDPPENQRNHTADGDAPGNDTPWDVVPWRIFRLPHERTYRISDAVGDQKDGIGRDSFRMTRGDGGDPGKDEDKAGHTDLECPDCTQVSNLIFPW